MKICFRLVKISS